MSDYFSEYIHEKRKAEDAEKASKTTGIIFLILIVIIIWMSIKYAVLSEKYSDLMYDYETYIEEHQ